MVIVESEMNARCVVSAPLGLAASHTPVRVGTGGSDVMTSPAVAVFEPASFAASHAVKLPTGKASMSSRLSPVLGCAAQLRPGLVRVFIDRLPNVARSPTKVYLVGRVATC